MADGTEAAYYVSRMAECSAEFERDAGYLRPFLVRAYGESEADAVLQKARQRFAAMLPRLPYIGGEENHLTGELLRSARCLALYMAMKASGKSAAEAGKILYDATLQWVSNRGAPPQQLSAEELMRRRAERARRSQRRQYAADWVYSFVPGDGSSFDYGYDFAECAVQKMYRAYGADEFLRYYCFLDFAVSRAAGLGLRRTMTLAEGYCKCDHRFRHGRRTEQGWPPPWLSPPERSSQSGSSAAHLTLRVLPQTLAVCRLDASQAMPAWLSSCSFWSVTRTEDELSVVLPEEDAPATWQAERGWRCLQVQGPLDFDLIGVLSSLSVPLADVNISIFVLSTYDTDYLLLRAADLDKARRVLSTCGHAIEEGT